jgi:hypothetical protein
MEGTNKLITTRRMVFSFILILLVSGCGVFDVRIESTQEPTQTSMSTSTETSSQTVATSTSLPKITPNSTSSPTEVSEIMIRGKIEMIAASARVIFLVEPVDSISEVAFSDDTQFILVEGTHTTYLGAQELKPGLTIEAIGHPGLVNSLLATEIRIISDGQP